MARLLSSPSSSSSSLIRNLCFLLIFTTLQLLACSRRPPCGGEVSPDNPRQSPGCRRL
ncbi:hypothetical protein BT93_J2045 [Corymbia citriodora subsp. variegata]|nr:hypothetical protein BT93_J2045 [Corymbia citriodora subsp. variegata]